MISSTQTNTQFKNSVIDENTTNTSNLPGRLGSNEIHYVKLGKTTIFYYMTKEKHELAQNLIKNLNSGKVQLTIDVTSPPCPVSEVSAVATKFIDPIGFDKDSNPIYKDPQGTKILDEYAVRVKEIAEKELNLSIKGLSREISFNLNQSALKWHRDYFTHQYEAFKNLKTPLPPYSLFQDLTLVDWQMTEKTFSATIVQDGRYGDRFMMLFFPGETVGTTYVESAVQNNPDAIPEYPGPITFQYHTALAPSEFNGSMTSGSSKGKRISTSTRGLVLTEEIENLTKKAKQISINSYKLKTDSQEKSMRLYENGIIMKELPKDFHFDIIGWNERLPEKENVSICQSKSEDYRSTIENLGKMFNLTASFDEVSVIHLTKRDGGFSQISLMDLDLPMDSHVVLINRSKLPFTYRHFNFAQDWSKKGIPWIQLYHCPPNMAIKMDAVNFLNLSLTPLEEIIYREESQDSLCKEFSKLREKFITDIDVFVFPLKK